MRAANTRAEVLGLSEDELAFYDALAARYSLSRSGSGRAEPSARLRYRARRPRGLCYLAARMTRSMGLQPGDVVLDLGCGKGESSISLVARRFGVKVVTVDLWIEAAYLASKMAARGHRLDVVPLNLDATGRPEPAGQDPLYPYRQEEGVMDQCPDAGQNDRLLAGLHRGEDYRHLIGRDHSKPQDRGEASVGNFIVHGHPSGAAVGLDRQARAAFRSAVVYMSPWGPGRS